MNYGELAIGSIVQHEGKIKKVLPSMLTMWYMDGKCDARPVELTEDFLARKGWHINGNYAVIEQDEEGNDVPLVEYNIVNHKLMVYVVAEEGYQYDISMQASGILYAHQMQHALRLCMLPLFADSLVNRYERITLE